MGARARGVCVCDVMGGASDFTAITGYTLLRVYGADRQKNGGAAGGVRRRQKNGKRQKGQPGKSAESGAGRGAAGGNAHLFRKHERYGKRLHVKLRRDPRDSHGIRGGEKYKGQRGAASYRQVKL